MSRQNLRTAEFPDIASPISPLVAPDGRINDFTLLADSSALRQSGDIRRTAVGKTGKPDCSRAAISTGVVARLDRATQYSRDSSAGAKEPRPTGSPDQVGR